jgi:hypothetical protein
MTAGGHRFDSDHAIVVDEHGLVRVVNRRTDVHRDQEHRVSWP